MKIIQRPYKMLSDFSVVYEFLTETYNTETFNGYLLPQFFEYSHTHPSFDFQSTYKFGLWEDENKLIGFVCYDWYVGECFINVKNDSETLLTETIKYAEEHLCEINNGKKSLGIWTTDKELAKKTILKNMGYEMVHSKPIKIFRYEKPFIEKSFPKGFSIISLEDENDFDKISDRRRILFY